MDGNTAFQRLRGRLTRRRPVLAVPLGLLDWAPGEKPGTDGRAFFAPPDWFAAADTEDVLLHSVLHAMLGHPWTRGRRDAARWDLACDMVAEFLRLRLLDKPLEGLYAKAFYACGDGAAYSVQRVCAWLEGDCPIAQDELREAFRRDSHAYWSAAAQREQRAGASGEGLAAAWKRQEGKLRPMMRTHQPRIGSGTAHQKLSLPELPDNQARFAALLREFSEVRENRHVNDADFAYSWYAYGMEHYDGMPLIEPLEYSEERKLHEMVIVLDTSASCSRGLCAWFLSAVRDILCRERLFFDRFRLHILQCDCEVQQDALVTNLDEFQWYLDHLELYGGGGTDFRPAFRHVDRLIEGGSLERLGGVLYFTDGYGVFPEEPPPYPAAFVMLQYRCDDINIPRWAKTLVLDAEKPGSEERWI